MYNTPKSVNFALLFCGYCDETEMKKDKSINIIYRLCVLIAVMQSSACDSAAEAQNKALEYFDSVDVSLLTCAPHDEIYSLYGHTAIRVQNRNTGDDFAVNFGVFDSSSRFFALRFVFGLTDYCMGIYSYESFLQEYRYYGSAVYEQHLNLTQREKQSFLAALADNAKPENAVYRYNYFYNNCTTKARDIIVEALDGTVEYKQTHLQKGERSFRDLIHMKTDEHPWARVGNDLLLGVGSDTNTMPSERQFLPEVLSNDFDSVVVVRNDDTRRPLVDSVSWVLLPGTPSLAHAPDFPLTPTQCAIIVLCVVALLCVVERFVLKKSLRWVDYSIVCLYGLAGIILFCMIFSQHPTVNVNLQILLFNPLLFFLAYPRRQSGTQYKWIVAMILLFFAGNIIQDYAEGANYLAVALLLISLNNIKK